MPFQRERRVVGKSRRIKFTRAPFFFTQRFSPTGRTRAGLGDVLTRATSSGSPTHKRNASLTSVMELPSFLPISLDPGAGGRCRVANFSPLLYRTIVNVLINNNELAHTLAAHNHVAVSTFARRCNDDFEPRVLSPPARPRPFSRPISLAVIALGFVYTLVLYAPVWHSPRRRLLLQRSKTRMEREIMCFLTSVQLHQITIHFALWRTFQKYTSRITERVIFSLN